MFASFLSSQEPERTEIGTKLLKELTSRRPAFPQLAIDILQQVAKMASRDIPLAKSGAMEYNVNLEDYLALYALVVDTDSE